MWQTQLSPPKCRCYCTKEVKLKYNMALKTFLFFEYPSLPVISLSLRLPLKCIDLFHLK